MAIGKIIFGEGVEFDYSWNIGVQKRIAKERKIGVKSQYDLVMPGDSEKHIENQIFAIYAAINQKHPDFTLEKCEQILMENDCDSKVLQLILSDMLQGISEVWQSKWQAVQGTAAEITKKAIMPEKIKE